MNCKHIKTSGEKCRAKSLKNSKYCYFHAPTISEQTKKEMRSKGGKSKIIKVRNIDFPEMKLNSVPEICQFIVFMINKILKNKLDIRIGTGINYLLQTLMKGIEMSELEKRLATLELKLSLKSRTESEQGLKFEGWD